MKRPGSPGRTTSTGSGSQAAAIEPSVHAKLQHLVDEDRSAEATGFLDFVAEDRSPEHSNALARSRPPPAFTIPDKGDPDQPGEFAQLRLRWYASSSFLGIRPVPNREPGNLSGCDRQHTVSSSRTDCLSVSVEGMFEDFRTSQVVNVVGEPALGVLRERSTSSDSNARRH